MKLMKHEMNEKPVKQALFIGNDNETETQDLMMMNAENSLTSDIKKHIDNYFASHCKNHAPERGLYDRIITEVEKILISSTMIYAQGNRCRASEILGINRNTLSKKIKELI